MNATPIRQPCGRSAASNLRHSGRPEARDDHGLWHPALGRAGGLRSGNPRLSHRAGWWPGYKPGGTPRIFRLALPGILNEVRRDKNGSFVV
jgi:hypothetical protein